MDLKTTLTNLLVIVVGAAFAMALGEYLGYKIGRWKFFWGIIVVVLVCIVAYAAYAVIINLG